MTKYYIPVNGLIIQCDITTYKSFKPVILEEYGIYVLMAIGRRNSRYCYLIKKELILSDGTNLGHMLVKQFISLKHAKNKYSRLIEKS